MSVMNTQKQPIDFGQKDCSANSEETCCQRFLSVIVGLIRLLVCLLAVIGMVVFYTLAIVFALQSPLHLIVVYLVLTNMK